jgi:3-hydroxyisobutyrate dehydrogenase
MSKPRVGFAGMGLMGSRMARNLLAKGFPLSVWSRNSVKCRPLAEAGAETAATPRALAEATDVVVACVADPPAVERLLFAEDGIVAAARPGFRYVEASTISPDLARRTAESLRAKGADALEAPMTGSKGGAENGTLLFMTGGRQETHDELQPVLMAMGTKAIYCGDTGQAATMKLIGNTLISFMLEGLCEGLVLGRKAGLSIDKMIEVIMASGYASPYFKFKGEAIARRNFEQQFSIDLLVKDQTLMLAEAARRLVPMPGLAAIREAHQSARAQGWGQDDIAGVVKALEKGAGLP